MQTITWAGREYAFDADALYRSEGGVLVLPDGTVLKVLEWYETLPPAPASVIALSSFRAEPKAGG
jgi:hypothetical protein